MTDLQRCPEYAAIKAMAAEMNRPASTLIALSDQRDPFYVVPLGMAWRAGSPKCGPSSTLPMASIFAVSTIDTSACRWATAPRN